MPSLNVQKSPDRTCFKFSAVSAGTSYHLTEELNVKGRAVAQNPIEFLTNSFEYYNTYFMIQRSLKPFHIFFPHGQISGFTIFFCSDFVKNKICPAIRTFGSRQYAVSERTPEYGRYSGSFCEWIPVLICVQGRRIMKEDFVILKEKIERK